MKHHLKAIFVVTTLLSISACQTVPNDALVLKQENLQMRSLQTRTFDTKDDMALLSAGVGVLQDLGFNIDFTEKKLGLVGGSKVADAKDNGEIAAQVALNIVLPLLAGQSTQETHWDDEQTIKASLFVRPISPTTMQMRVTFQRTVIDNHGRITKLQAIQDTKIYQDFYSAVSKSVFLEANEI